MIVVVGGEVFGCDMPLKRGVQYPQMEVAVDLAELFAGLNHPGGATSAAPSACLAGV
jgi:hypothetical protein